MIIEVSDTASDKIVEILSSADIQNAFLRVGVDEGDAVVCLIPLSWMNSRQKKTLC